MSFNGITLAECATQLERFKVSCKSAFTLAEVLITLGIIGVVAAMTMPSLIQKQQKKAFLAQAKVVYSILNNALERTKVHYGTDIENWEFAQTGSNLDKSMFFAEKYLIPNLKVIEYCKKSTSSAVCNHSVKLYGTYTNTDLSSFKPQTNYGTTFALNNSAIVNIQVGDINEVKYRVRMIYDVNGIKKPNVMGQDTFMIELGGKLGGGDINRFLPYGHNNEKDCSYYKNGFQSNLACTQNSGRASCLAYIMCNGWDMPEDYPW